MTAHSVEPQRTLATLSQSTAAPSACSAQPYFDKDTQSYEWQMVCD